MKTKTNVLCAIALLTCAFIPSCGTAPASNSLDNLKNGASVAVAGFLLVDASHYDRNVAALTSVANDLKSYSGSEVPTITFVTEEVAKYFPQGAPYASLANGLSLLFSGYYPQINDMAGAKAVLGAIADGINAGMGRMTAEKARAGHAKMQKNELARKKG